MVTEQSDRTAPPKKAPRKPSVKNAAIEDDNSEALLLALENEERLKNISMVDKLVLDEQIRRSTEWNSCNSYEVVESSGSVTSELEENEKRRRVQLINESTLESNKIRDESRLISIQLARKEKVCAYICFCFHARNFSSLNHVILIMKLMIPKI